MSDVIRDDISALMASHASLIRDAQWLQEELAKFEMLAAQTVSSIRFLEAYLEAAAE